MTLVRESLGHIRTPRKPARNFHVIWRSSFSLFLTVCCFPNDPGCLLFSNLPKPVLLLLRLSFGVLCHSYPFCPFVWYSVSFNTLSWIFSFISPIPSIVIFRPLKCSSTSLTKNLHLLYSRYWIPLSPKFMCFHIIIVFSCLFFDIHKTPQHFLQLSWLLPIRLFQSFSIFLPDSNIRWDLRWPMLSSPSMVTILFSAVRGPLLLPSSWFEIFCFF